MGYIDDSYLQGDTRDECRLNIVSTATVFTELSFYIHPSKSVFLSTQTLTFLGFILNSIKMTISPTPEKVEKIVKARRQLVKKTKPLILDVAKVIGLIISLFPGAEYGLATSDVHNILEIPATDEIHMEDRNHGLA